MTARYA